uniref:Uncharacterized protein n=1 Tax=Myoviridae sp. ctfrL10 TaxID=2826678 RepID=A0A8S5MRE0_9CAUD|nr:MAG TPA: hypothetical protein [Myoviridae sp. ctfrL10]
MPLNSIDGKYPTRWGVIGGVRQVSYRVLCSLFK